MESASAPREVAVLLSGSIPDQPNEAARQRAEKRLMGFLGELTRGVLASGWDIVFGGHPTITPVLHTLSKKMNLAEGRLHLFQLKRFEDRAPLEVKDNHVFPQVRWIPVKGAANHFVNEELIEMRQEMVARADAGVFVGGRTGQNVGGTAGIRMEYDLFLAAHPQGPAYLVGLLGGTVADFIREHESKQTREPNGLPGAQLEYVRNSPNPDTVASLILADMRQFSLDTPRAPGSDRKHGKVHSMPEPVLAPETAATARPPSASRRFKVALSFPGEHRALVDQIASGLALRLEQKVVFYDKYFEAELARPNLDTYLQAIYHDQTELLVIFLCAAFDRKKWCGLEWRAIRDVMAAKKDEAIMFIRVDSAKVAGVFDGIDGWIDAEGKSPEEIVLRILERLQMGQDKPAVQDADRHASTETFAPALDERMSPYGIKRFSTRKWAAALFAGVAGLTTWAVLGGHMSRRNEELPFALTEPAAKTNEIRNPELDAPGQAPNKPVMVDQPGNLLDPPVQAPSTVLDATVQALSPASKTGVVVKEIRRFAEHAAAISSVAFDPDGKVAVSASSGERTVRRWDLATGKGMRPGWTWGDYEEHFALSPGGARVLYNKFTNVHMDDARTGLPVREPVNLCGAGGTLGARAISRDARRAILAMKADVSGSYKAWARVLDLETGNMATFEGHKDELRIPSAVALSADGTIAASASNDGLCVWAVADPGKERVRINHDAVISLAFSSDGEALLAGETTDTLILWDTRSGKERLRFKDCPGPVSCVAISHDDRWVLSGSVTGIAWLWDSRTGAKLARLEGHTGDVTCLIFADDGRFALTGGADKTVRLWDLTALQDAKIPSK